jgi:hypothetical protein
MFTPDYSNPHLSSFSRVTRIICIGEVIVSLRMLCFLTCLFLPPAFAPIAYAQVPLTERREQAPPVDEQREKIEKEMAKKANQQRQADLKRDTDKLLQLATQLKQYVDKTNENVLSLDVMKKAEEIEKLAHSVREKMKGNN